MARRRGTDASTSAAAYSGGTLRACEREFSLRGDGIRGREFVGDSAATRAGTERSAADHGISSGCAELFSRARAGSYKDKARKYSGGGRSTEVIERYAERNWQRGCGHATNWHLCGTGICDSANLHGRRRLVAGSDAGRSIDATHAGPPRRGR